MDLTGLSEEYALIVPFEHENIHHCGALVLMCADFRFRRQVFSFLDHCLEQSSYDVLGLPGGGREITQGSTAVLNYIKLLCNRHEPSVIVLVHHEDCAAYGGSEAFGHDSLEERYFHRIELLRIRDILLKHGIQKEIVLVYQQLVNDKKDIGFVIVKPEEKMEDHPGNVYEEVA